MIELEQDDLIQTKNAYIIQFVSKNNGIIVGLDVNDGEIVRITEQDIECVKKNNIKPKGGDNENYWMFYCGPGYNVNSIIIANWARYELPNIFFDMSEDEIIHKHLYWATESKLYNGVYNGDTFILFNNINLLPEDYKLDAFEKCK